MRILLLTHGFNCLTQRFQLELLRLGHQMAVEFDINDEVAVDAVQRKEDREASPRLRHADALATALQFAIADRFTPTAENVFGRISRDGILAAIIEAKGTVSAPAWAKMKKSELAALAEREVTDTDWLPAPMRIDNAVTLADANLDDGDVDDCEAILEAAE